MNQQTPSVNKPPIMRPWILIVLVLVIIGAGLYYYFAIYSQKSTSTTPVATSTPTLSPSSKASSSPSASAATSLTYTNSTFGFTLTFPASWAGYKMKEKVFTDSVMTYYITFPTTDSGAVASDINDAGYYSPFAISVYTLAQWDAIQAEEGPKPDLITKNATYAFGWSQANGVPASDFGTKSEDIKTIIDSFKLK